MASPAADQGLPVLLVRLFGIRCRDGRVYQIVPSGTGASSCSTVRPSHNSPPTPPASLYVNARALATGGWWGKKRPHHHQCPLESAASYLSQCMLTCAITTTTRVIEGHCGCTPTCVQIFFTLVTSTTCDSAAASRPVTVAPPPPPTHFVRCLLT